MASMLERYALDAMIVARCRRPLGHEMKNAVQGLYSGIEILNKAIESQGKARIGPADCVPLLRRQLDGLQEALHRVLDDVAPQPGEPGAVDVAALVRDLVRFLMSDAAVAGVRVELDAPQSLAVRARAHVIRRVLLGFTLDAIDAMRGGGALQLRVKEGEAAAIVELRDSRSAQGLGAVPSEHVRIDTDLLRRVATELMSEEQGALSVEPLADRGCQVQISLPRA
jgi:signal transduction histidine kinase